MVRSLRIDQKSTELNINLSSSRRREVAQFSCKSHFQLKAEPAERNGTILDATEGGPADRDHKSERYGEWKWQTTEPFLQMKSECYVPDSTCESQKHAIRQKMHYKASVSGCPFPLWTLRWADVTLHCVLLKEYINASEVQKKCKWEPVLRTLLW